MDKVNRRRGHRWLQLSLRSLFLLTLIVAAYFAGYRTAVRQAEDAQAAEREARLSAPRAAAEARKAEQLAERVDLSLIQAAIDFQTVEAQRAVIEAENKTLARERSEAQQAELHRLLRGSVEMVEPEER
jgi:hypothetical protein